MTVASVILAVLAVETLAVLAFRALAWTNERMDPADGFPASSQLSAGEAGLGDRRIA